MSDVQDSGPGARPRNGGRAVRRVHGHPEHEMTPVQAARHIQDVFREIREKYRAENEDFDEEDAHELVTNSRPEKPEFPIFIFSCAVMADGMDIFLDAGVVSIPLAMLLGVFTSLMLFFWLWGKVKGQWYKKLILGWAWRAFIITAFVEIFPILNIFPANTIFVLMAHFRETKIVRLMNIGLDVIHERGVFKYLEA